MLSACGREKKHLCRGNFTDSGHFTRQFLQDSYQGSKAQKEGCKTGSPPPDRCPQVPEKDVLPRLFALQQEGSNIFELGVHDGRGLVLHN